MGRLFSRSKSKQFEIVKLEKGNIDVRDPEVHLQLTMISLSEEELAYAPTIQKLLEKDDHLPKLADAFYDALSKVEKITNLINKYSSFDRLKQTMQQHIYEMFAGEITDEFLEKRLRIAKTHHRIGLEPKWYMGSFLNFIDYILHVIDTNVSDEVMRRKLKGTALKLLNFEQQLVLELYERENVKERERQYTLVKDEIKSKVARLSQELAALSEQTSATIQELVTTSMGVQRSVNNSADQSKKTKSRAENGQVKVDSIANHMITIHQSMNSLVSVVEHLSNSSREIQSVISFVQDIAEQTNLLSLNSSIEAARAGEHGRGFAVVAQEVKNLSSKTKESVKQIEKIIRLSNQLTSNVVSAIQDIQNQMKLCMEDVDHTYTSFDEMVTYIDQSIQEVSRVESEIKQLSLGIEMMSTAVINVAESAEVLNESIQSL